MVAGTLLGLVKKSRLLGIVAEVVLCSVIKYFILCSEYLFLIATKYLCWRRRYVARLLKETDWNMLLLDITILLQYDSLIRINIKIINTL